MVARDDWRRAIELGARLGLFSAERLAEARRRLDAHRDGTPSADEVAVWVGRSAAVVEGLLDLLPHLPADTSTERLHETIRFHGEAVTSLTRALLDPRCTPRTVPLVDVDMPTAKIGTPAAETHVIAPLSAAPDASIPSCLLPSSLRHKFTLCDLLGAGAFGQVFRATQLGLSRAIALKLIPLDEALDQAESEHVTREGIALARLQHTNILTVFESGQAGAVYYLAMELADGSFDSELKRLRRSDILYCVQLARQILGGVAAAHDAGIIHRDLKPANTLLFRRDGATTLKLADFGLARLVQRYLVCEHSDSAPTDPLASRSGRLAGTPAYLSPECWRNEAQSPASDVFAAGVMLFELFVGRHPFPARDLHQLAYRIAHDEPPPIETLNPSLPRSIATLVGSMLAKAPSARPSAVEADAQLAEALSPFRVHGVSTPFIASEHFPADVLAASRRAGKSLVGRYVCVRILAEFGVTLVLQGWDPVLADHVLIKTVGHDAATDWVKRNLLAEARTMARIRHPAVLRPRDLVQEADSYSVVYDGYAGEWLSDTIHPGGRTRGPHRTAWYDDPTRFIDLLLQLTYGLDAAHECVPRLIHGNVKPDTVLVTDDDRVILTSFETVHESGAGSSLVAGLRGSMAYSPPEILLASHDRVGPFSDVFCLGCILYEMLCGASPRLVNGGGAGAAALLKRVQDGELFPRPSTMLPDAASPMPRIEAVCMRAVAPDPVERFQSMPEFAAALRAATGP